MVSISLSGDCPNLGELSSDLFNGGAFPLRMADNGLVLIPAKHHYQFIPSGARDLKFFNLPPPLAKRGLVQEVLQMAGYTVQLPATSCFAPAPPAPGHVTLLRLRYGHTPMGGSDMSTLIATVLPPTDDAFLCKLPPAFYLPGWRFAIMCLVDNDELPHVRVAPQKCSPSEVVFPMEVDGEWEGGSELQRAMPDLRAQGTSASGQHQAPVAHQPPSPPPASTQQPGVMLPSAFHPSAPTAAGHASAAAAAVAAPAPSSATTAAASAPSTVPSSAAATSPPSAGRSQLPSLHTPAKGGPAKGAPAPSAPAVAASAKATAAKTRDAAPKAATATATSRDTAPKAAKAAPAKQPSAPSAPQSSATAAMAAPFAVAPVKAAAAVPPPQPSSPTVPISSSVTSGSTTSVPWKSTRAAAAAAAKAVRSDNMWRQQTTSSPDGPFLPVPPSAASIPTPHVLPPAAIRPARHKPPPDVEVTRGIRRDKLRDTVEVWGRDDRAGSGSYVGRTRSDGGSDDQPSRGRPRRRTDTPLAPPPPPAPRQSGRSNKGKAPDPWWVVPGQASRASAASVTASLADSRSRSRSRSREYQLQPRRCSPPVAGGPVIFPP